MLSVCSGRIFTGKVLKSEASTKNPDIDWNEEAYKISATSRGKEIKLFLKTVDLECGKKKTTHGCNGNDTNNMSDEKSNETGSRPKSLDILLRFGMTGKIELQDKNNMAKHSHLNFYTQEGNQVLSFIDVMRLGRWELTSSWGLKRGPCVITEYSLFRYSN